MGVDVLIAIAAVLAATAIVLAFVPLIRRDTRRRWANGMGGGGMGAALDAVWRPSAQDAHAEWNAQSEMPAPAPSPGDKGLDEGVVVIHVR
ncbi:hypothetical protein GCM10009808_09090 [Microbacterium sediminicola]|uniref:Uncharacterized protein n=1 Tax=Microbacterium sediminicola TaxID=415210 RepID=A0ABP4TWN2_9MICO